MSATRSLARAGLVVSAAFLAARVLGWLRFVVIANVFGATADLDAFIAAFRIPDLMFQLVAAGALSAALIPVVAGVLHTDGEARAWRVVSTVTTLMLVALLVLAAFALVAADRLVPLFTRGFDPATMARTIELTRIMLLSPILLALGAVATSVLNARGRFAAAALAPIAYNVAIIGAVLLLAPSMGVTGVAVGVVAGSASHLLVQLRPLRAIGFRYVPRIDLSDRAARQALALMGPRAIGLGASQITFIVATALATPLGTGALTAFTSAFTLLQIPIGVIGVPLGVVLFPSLSREVATGNHDEFVSLLTRAMRLLAFVMIPIAAVAAILRIEGVSLLFRRFDPATVELIAATLVAFLVGLAAHALIGVLARAFYARQDTKTPVMAAILAVVVNTTLATLLVGPLQLPGIALAIAIAAWVEAGVLLLLLHRRVGRLGLAQVAWLAVRTVLATAVATIAAGIVHAAVAASLAPQATAVGLGSILALVAIILVVTAVFAAVFALAAIALRIEELRSIVGIMVDALRRPRRP
ncbi:MAG: putative peptidoglycan lipid flippase [Chloroflexota bacterium]|nr:putative peptidoglycan lipid flippase [Chloroflexota bacterium]